MSRARLHCDLDREDAAKVFSRPTEERELGRYRDSRNQVIGDSRSLSLKYRNTRVQCSMFAALNRAH